MGIAQRAPSGFICGYIGAENGQPKTCYPMREEGEKNAALETIRMKMKDNGETLFAYFETLEPNQEAPHKSELEALNEGIYFLGISLSTKGVLELSAFELDNGNVSAVDLMI